MYCSECGAQNDDRAYRCVQCGAVLPQAPVAQPPAPASYDVPTYLAQAILVTLLCCLPFGIVAIVYAAQVNGLLAGRQYEMALEKSNSARTWCWAAFVCGLVLAVIWLLLVGLGAAVGFRSA